MGSKRFSTSKQGLASELPSKSRKQAKLPAQTPLPVSPHSSRAAWSVTLGFSRHWRRLQHDEEKTLETGIIQSSDQTLTQCLEAYSSSQHFKPKAFINSTFHTYGREHWTAGASFLWLSAVESKKMYFVVWMVVAFLSRKESRIGRKWVFVRKRECLLHTFLRWT